MLWREYISGIQAELRNGFDSAFSYGPIFDKQEEKIKSIVVQLEKEMNEGFIETGEIEDGLYYYGYFNDGNIHCFHAKTFTRTTKKNIKKQCRLFCKGPFRITFETENIESDNIESNIFSWGEFSDNNFQMFRKHTRGCYKFNDRDNYYVYCSDGNTLPKTDEKKNTLDYHYNHLFHNRHSRIFDTNGNSLISSALYVALKDNNIRNVDNIRSIKNNHKQYEMLYQEIYEKKICFSERQNTTKHKERLYDSDDVFIFAPLFGYPRWIKIKSFANNISISSTNQGEQITSDQFESLYLNIGIDPGDIGSLKNTITEIPTKRYTKQTPTNDCKKKWIPWINEIYITKSTDSHIHYKNTEFSIRIKDYPTIVIDFFKIIDKSIPKKINIATIKGRQQLIKSMKNPVMQCKFLQFLLYVEEYALLAADSCDFMNIKNQKIKEACTLITAVRDDIRTKMFDMLDNDVWKSVLNKYLTFRPELDKQIGFKVSDNIDMEILRFYTIKTLVASSINMNDMDNMDNTDILLQIRQKFNEKIIDEDDTDEDDIDATEVQFFILLKKQIADRPIISPVGPVGPVGPVSPVSPVGSTKSQKGGETKSPKSPKSPTALFSVYSPFISSYSPGTPLSRGTPLSPIRFLSPQRNQLRSKLQHTEQLRLRFTNHWLDKITDDQEDKIKVVVGEYLQILLNVLNQNVYEDRIHIHTDIEYYQTEIETEIETEIVISYNLQTIYEKEYTLVGKELDRVKRDPADINLVILIDSIEKILQVVITEFEFVTDTDPFRFPLFTEPNFEDFLQLSPVGDGYQWDPLRPSSRPSSRASDSRDSRSSTTPEMTPDTTPVVTPAPSRPSSRASTTPEVTPTPLPTPLPTPPQLRF